jgi:outer membrane scaffolding protein for murein synthesis (MipA/OmpV family)
MILLRLVALLLWLLSPLIRAEDIARDLRGNGSAPNHSDGGYFELGFGAAYVVDPFLAEADGCDSHRVCPSLFASGAYRYKGAFIELADATYDGLNLGYSLWDNEHWAVDILALNIFGEPSDDERTSDDPERQKDLNLIQRSRLFVGTGTRITGYFGNTILQLRWVGDISDDHGAVGSLRIGQSFQYRNWNFHTMVSADWLSAKATNYWIGVSPQEATTRFAAYQTDSSVYLSGEVGVTYPISDHWVGRTYLRYAALPDKVANSPLIDENHALVLAATVSYAF